MISGRRLLITGGAGFIGSHLAQRLMGANEVVIYDNFRRNALIESIEEDARIDNLPMLPTCDAQAIFADLIEIGGPVVITGTLPDACGP